MNAQRPSEPVDSPEKISRSSVGRVSRGINRLFGGAKSLQATGRILRRQLWAWPVLAIIIFGGAGWWVNQAVELAMREQRATDLNTMVDASVEALNVWMGEQQVNARLFAADEQLHTRTVELLKIAEANPGDKRELVRSEIQERLRSWLIPRISTEGYIGFFVVSPDGVMLSADQDSLIGETLSGYRREIFEKTIANETFISKPYRSRLLLPDENGELRANLPTMMVTSLIRDLEGKPIGSLGLRIRPEDQFTKILQVVRYGQSGETYAFDRNGLLLSESRFDDQLKQIGLLVDQPDSRSILTVELRNPQVNMVAGERPAMRRSEQPLIEMAADAVQGKSGCDANGHRDYRGVMSVGAWRWLEEYDMGVGTGVDMTEAFRPVYILRRAFRILISLLVLSAIGIFIAMLYIERQQRALQTATLAANQLGQYSLEKKLGAGGMGTVYKARHAMLRRPTAVKLLDIDKMSDAAIARFEREVQLTSALTHPNTVAVFDYGRTPDGIFYYAMEYLEGMNLDELVNRFGPVQEARTVYILKQLCGSLSEAHTTNLVHRDIKPANIFLTCRGSLFDFVKVLDFGLVKALDDDKSANLTNPNGVTGTPLYLSPEAVTQPDQVDARADVYAIGAVGYYLLTGTPVFTGATVMDICMKHVKEEPEAPSIRLGKPICPSLETIILKCLAKTPDRRPKTAEKLLHELDGCRPECQWTPDDAKGWWNFNIFKKQLHHDDSTVIDGSFGDERSSVYQETIMTPIQRDTHSTNS